MSAKKLSIFFALLVVLVAGGSAIYGFTGHQVANNTHWIMSTVVVILAFISGIFFGMSRKANS